jgi:hypothetical protein
MDPTIGGMVTKRNRPGQGRAKKEFYGPHDGGHALETMPARPWETGDKLSRTTRWGPCSKSDIGPPE